MYTNETNRYKNVLVFSRWYQSFFNWIHIILCKIIITFLIYIYIYLFISLNFLILYPILQIWQYLCRKFYSKKKTDVLQYYKRFLQHILYGWNFVQIRSNPDPQHTHSELVVFIDFPPSSPFYCLNYWRIYIYIYRSCKFLLLYVPSTIRKYFTLPWTFNAYLF